MKLLVLSNGHGEDLIACKIIKELQKEIENISIVCLPLVGEGYAYKQLDIPMIAPPQAMPSGGFIYMETQQLWQDIRSGLIQLTLAQYKAIKQWAKKGGVILAVGDIIPLLFAYLSGVNYAFIATAKSEYWLRDEQGWLKETSMLQRFWGSIYYPWERFLMNRNRCQAVFPRDKITTDILKQYQIPAFDMGNPMMDDLEVQSPNFSLNFDQENRPLIILLLPGSRFPEALRNWETIITAVENVIKLLPSPIIFLAAISPSLNLDEFENELNNNNWQKTSPQSVNLPIKNDNLILFIKNEHQILLSQNTYAEFLTLSDLAIAMSGTATEQFIGLGKPAISIIGKGPQYSAQFAHNQALLLGISLILVKKPEEVSLEIKNLLENPDFWQLIVDNGKERMGLSGASNRIAICLKKQFIFSE